VNRLLFSTEFYDPVPHMRRVIRFISQQYPFWNATGGRDHVFWLARDKGALSVSCSRVVTSVFPLCLLCAAGISSVLDHLVAFGRVKGEGLPGSH